MRENCVFNYFGLNNSPTHLPKKYISLHYYYSVMLVIQSLKKTLMSFGLEKLPSVRLFQSNIQTGNRQSAGFLPRIMDSD